jgi:putative MATE family efflux protein
MAFVGRLGPASVAAVGISGQVLMLLFTVFMGIATAATAMVARAIGAGDQERADAVAAQALLLSLVASVVVGGVGYALAPRLLSIFGAEPEVVRLATGYLRIMFVGIAAILSLFTGAGILRGAGDALTPLLISVVAGVANGVLDPLLIFGLLGFPRLGVHGAAVASVAAQFIGFGIGLYVLTSGRTRVRLRLGAFRPDPATLWRIVAVGVPSSVQMVLRAVMGVVLLPIVAGFGTHVLAAFTVGGRLMMVGFMPTFGIAAASATLVGQNLGAGRPERAEKSALASTGMSVAIMAAAAVVASACAPFIIGAFAPEPGVVDAGRFFLRIAAPGLVFAAVGITLGRAVAGAGDTVPPMIIALLVLWGLQVPLAYFLARIPSMGETGVYWAGTLAGLAQAAMTSAYFFTGRWKRKRL